MCEPVTLSYIGLGLAAVSGAAQYEGQRKSASQQADGLRKQQLLEQNDLIRQQQQIDAATRQQMSEASKAALRDMDLFGVVAGEYGGGRSVDRIAAIGDVNRGEQLATIAANRDNSQVENRFQSLATATATNSRLSSIQRPSLIETGLRIGGAAVNARQSQLAAQRPKS